MQLHCLSSDFFCNISNCLYSVPCILGNLSLSLSTSMTLFFYLYTRGISRAFKSFQTTGWDSISPAQPFNVGWCSWRAYFNSHYILQQDAASSRIIAAYILSITTAASNGWNQRASASDTLRKTNRLADCRRRAVVVNATLCRLIAMWLLTVAKLVCARCSNMQSTRLILCKEQHSWTHYYSMKTRCFLMIWRQQPFLVDIRAYFRSHRTDSWR